MSHKKTTEQFIAEAKAKAKYGAKTDYSKVNYINARTEVCFICQHGHEYWQTPMSHLRGAGCHVCANNQRKTNEQFKARARALWGDKYDLSRVNYTNWRTPIEIGCDEHGFVRVIPNNFLRGHGCPQCGISARNAAKLRGAEEFIKLATKIHGNTYDYTHVEYKGCGEPVLIICPAGHQFWQKPSKHLLRHGCSFCKQSQGEMKIALWLEQHGVLFKRQYVVYPDAVLFGRKTFRVDFYLQEFNTFIEYHGEQHYSFIPYFHKSESDFQEQQDRDKRLREYCSRHKIRLIEIPFFKLKKIEALLNKEIGAHL